MATKIRPTFSNKMPPQAALGLRYTFGDNHRVHPYVEGGGWVTPNETLSLSRPYANGAGISTGNGSTDATAWTFYGKLGVAYELTTRDQINGWGDLDHEELKYSGYSEEISSSNPFPATVQSGTASLDIARTGLSLTHRLTDRLAVTGSAAIAHSFDARSGLNVTVAPMGMMTAEAPDATWGEFGAGIDIGLTKRLTLDLSAEGTTGGSNVGTSFHGGGGLSYSF